MVHVVTFANKNNAGFINFQKSFERFRGWDLHIIGKKVAWKGWITRMTHYRDYARKTDPNEILVFLDAFDVVCIRDSDNFEKNFQDANKKYVFGCERVCNTMATCKKPVRWQKVNHVYNFFVNGGCIIARAKDIAYMWEWCIQNKHTKDDQVALGYFMDAHPHDIVLDTRHTFIFNDLFGKSDLSIQDNKIMWDEQRLHAYFIHFPGLMLLPSISLNFHVGKVPANYVVIVKHILGDEGITELPINTDIYEQSWIGITVIFIMIFLLLVLFIVLYALCKNKNRHLKDL